MHIMCTCNVGRVIVSKKSWLIVSKSCLGLLERFTLPYENFFALNSLNRDCLYPGPYQEFLCYLYIHNKFRNDAIRISYGIILKLEDLLW